MPILLGMYIILVTHTFSDNSLEEDVKSVSSVVLVILGILYLIFGLVF